MLVYNGDLIALRLQTQYFDNAVGYIYTSSQVTWLLKFCEQPIYIDDEFVTIRIETVLSTVPRSSLVIAILSSLWICFLKPAEYSASILRFEISISCIEQLFDRFLILLGYNAVEGRSYIKFRNSKIEGI